MILCTLNRSLSRRVSREIWESRDKFIHIMMKANARASNAFILTKIENLLPRGGISRILTSNDMNILKKIYLDLSLERFLLICFYLDVYISGSIFLTTLWWNAYIFPRSLRSYGRYVHTGLLQVDFSFGVLKFDRCLISWLGTHASSAIRRLVSDQCVVLQSGSFEWLVDLASSLLWTDDGAPLHSLPKVLKQYQIKFLIV
jgi:hypothetical protein